MKKYHYLGVSMVFFERIESLLFYENRIKTPDYDVPIAGLIYLTHT